MKIIKTLVILFVALLLLNACTPDRSTKIYSASETLQAEDVEEGVVESVEAATLRKDGTVVGTGGGTIIGAIAGSTVGGGTGKSIASVGGAIIGGLLGHYLEQGITDQAALKIVIKLDSGEKIVIVQEADVPFQKGERVNVFSSRVDNTKRVSKL